METTNRKLVFIGNIEPYCTEKDTVRSQQFKRLLAEAERCKTLDLPEVHPNGSTTYMGIAIVNLALAYRLTKEDKYLEQAREIIRTVLGYEKWGHAHLVNVDLSASWILWGLSLGYDWLREFLTEDENTAIRSKIIHHAQIIYDYKIDTAGAGWSTEYYQNHNWINMNGLATAGYVLEADGGGGEHYITEAKSNFAKVYEYMPEDGSNYEGVVYWRYGGMWLFVYAHLLKMQEGTDYFVSNEYLKNTFYYRLYQSASDLATQLNYGDAHDRYSGHPACVYYKVASEYKDGYAQTFANLVLDKFIDGEAKNSKVKPGILPEAGLEFLWYAPEVEEKPLEELPKVRFFKDLGLLSIRDSWSTDGKAFTIKCSPPGGAKQWETGWKLYKEEGIDCLSLAHHHPDNLAYIYTDGSEFLTCEDGYNRNILPDNHNVLLVDGKFTDVMDVNDVYTDSAKSRLEANPDMDIVNKYRGDVTNFFTKEGITGYSADTHHVYPKDLEMTEVSRTFFTDNLDFIVFLDRFESKADHVFSIISNTCEVADKLDDNTFIYKLNGKSLNYVVNANVALSPRQYEQEVCAVMTTQEPDKVCKTHIKTVTFETEGCKSASIFECIVPEGMKVSYEENKMTLQGEKTYTFYAKEGFAKYGIQCKASMYVEVSHDGMVSTYEV